MSRKKILFFIVEGISDSSALQYMLEKIFNNQHVVVKIAGGDITSDLKTTVSNVPTKITQLIKSEYGAIAKPGDFIEVIQLVDLDGVFIDPENVVYENQDHIIYDETCIRCKNVEAIKNRNKSKAAILDRMIHLKTVWRSIPYSVYFFSCNLDHVIHNNANLDDNLKDKKATKFALKYKDNPKGFISYFTDSPFSLVDDYNHTWEFIKGETNSLKRYSNFGLLFTEYAKNGKLFKIEEDNSLM